jgi:uncharacterized protein YkwD
MLELSSRKTEDELPSGPRRECPPWSSRTLIVKPPQSGRKHPFLFSLSLPVLLLVLQGTQFSTDSSAVCASSPQHVLVSNPKWEEIVLQEVNRLRQRRGLVPLKVNAKAQVAARKHSLDMAKLGYFSHQDLQGRFVDDRLRRVKLSDWRGIAENIAKCSVSSNAAQETVVGWSKSPGHAKNMFNPIYSETGIGAVLDPDHDILFCQVFVAP